VLDPRDLAFAESSIEARQGDDKNGINAFKLLGITFTAANGVLVRMREKGTLTVGEALAKLATLGKHGRYKHSILEDARRKLETKL
jgi:hypothetical protein